MRIAVNGSLFDVRLRGNLAEAIRLNPEYAPRFGPIAGRAAVAMAVVSGCDVPRVLGDQALVTGVLLCSPDALQGQLVIPENCQPVPDGQLRFHDPPIVDLICILPD